MRKFAATALTALTLSLMGSAAALADSAPYQGPGYQGPGYNQQYNGPQGPRGPQPPQGGPQGWYQDEYFDANDRGVGDRGFGDRGFGDRGGWRGDRGFDDHRFDNDRRFNRNFNFQLQFGNFDRWERGWGYGNWQNQYRFNQPLNTWRLVRILERQGFYGVRGLQKARWGFGYRAFAFNYRGQPVMLRVNPYTGRVMDVRYI